MINEHDIEDMRQTYTREDVEKAYKFNQFAIENIETYYQGGSIKHPVYTIRTILQEKLDGMK